MGCPFKNAFFTLYINKAKRSTFERAAHSSWRRFDFSPRARFLFAKIIRIPKYGACYSSKTE
jgi:hypothetical protein